MFSFKKLHHKHTATTLYKYFISYFLLLTILTLGYTVAFRVQLKNIYTKELHTQAEKQLADIGSDLASSISTVEKIQYLLAQDPSLTMSRYLKEDWYLYQAFQTLTKYTTANEIISGICYIHFEKNHILSSKNSVRKTDNGYEIYSNHQYIPFPLETYLENAAENQLILLGEGKSRLLVYLPANNGIKTYSIFYILNLDEIEKMLSRRRISGMASVCLMNQNNEIVTGYEPLYMTSYLKDYGIADNASLMTASEKVLTEQNILNGFSLVTILSDDAILSQVSIAFRNAYAFLLLVSFAGMGLIFLGMRATYWPLHKLTLKLLPSGSQHGNYVEQLDTAFSNVRSENQQLQQKIDSYRLSMQKSLLDSIVADNALFDTNDSAGFDHLFCMEPGSHIFILRIKTPGQKESFPADVQKLLNTSLPGEIPSALLLERTEESAVFLICYTGAEPNKDEVLHLLLTDLYHETGYQSALSNGAESLLEIPSLYENTAAASEFWDHTPVVIYSEIAAQAASTGSLSYPYQNLELLTDALKSCQITQAKEQILYLFELLDTASAKNSSFPNFFIRCVLIDILTILSSGMNNLNVKFKNYSDLYFNTLFLCRSCSYAEKKEEIHQNILLLLATYEKEFQNSTIQFSKIEETIQKEYSSPDFSISGLADTFHVSIAYMSYLFKKGFDVNFSEYLWNIRMEKAKELLSQTDMNIDQISVQVGYLNTSSFRRKFKQETGFTPSQYRSSHSPS